jgi:hypothetical protein
MRPKIISVLCGGLPFASALAAQKLKALKISRASNLGHPIADQADGNILRRYKIAPTPEPSRTTT